MTGWALEGPDGRLIHATIAGRKKDAIYSAFEFFQAGSFDWRPAAGAEVIMRAAAKLGYRLVRVKVVKA
jgi:hypothetical protein